MKHVCTNGLDLAKHVFQVHGPDIEGLSLSRSSPRRDTLRPERDAGGSDVRSSRRRSAMKSLTKIPDVGAITAATIRARVPDSGGFKSASHFAAWVGLTPRPHSSGGKERLGGISKMGNPEPVFYWCSA